MHVGIAYPRWRGKRSRHSWRMRIRNFTYLVRGPCGITYEAGSVPYMMDSLQQIPWDQCFIKDAAIDLLPLVKHLSKIISIHGTRSKQISNQTTRSQPYMDIMLNANTHFIYFTQRSGFWLFWYVCSLLWPNKRCYCAGKNGLSVRSVKLNLLIRYLSVRINASIIYEMVGLCIFGWSSSLFNDCENVYSQPRRDVFTK